MLTGRDVRVNREAWTEWLPGDVLAGRARQAAASSGIFSCVDFVALPVGQSNEVLALLLLGEDFDDCLDATDSNDDGSVDVSDPMTTLNFLFLGGLPLPPPTDAPRIDPTPDALDC